VQVQYPCFLLLLLPISSSCMFDRSTRVQAAAAAAAAATAFCSCHSGVITPVTVGGSSQSSQSCLIPPCWTRSMRCTGNILIHEHTTTAGSSHTWFNKQQLEETSRKQIAFPPLGDRDC